MKMLFNVDQKAALRLGHDAPQSTVALDINPQELEQEERDILAELLVDGYCLTKTGLDPQADVACSSTDGINRIPVTLYECSLQGVKDAIARAKADWATAAAAHKEEKLLKRQKADKLILEKMAEPPKSFIRYLSTTGNQDKFYLDTAGYKRSEYAVPVEQFSIEIPDYTWHAASEEVREQFRLKQEQCRAESQAAVEAAKPAALEAYKAWKQREDELDRQDKEAYDSLNANFRGRYEAGFATEEMLLENLAWHGLHSSTLDPLSWAVGHPKTRYAKAYPFDKVMPDDFDKFTQIKEELPDYMTAELLADPGTEECMPGYPDLYVWITWQVGRHTVRVWKLLRRVEFPIQKYPERAASKTRKSKAKKPTKRDTNRKN